MAVTTRQKAHKKFDSESIFHTADEVESFGTRTEEAKESDYSDSDSDEAPEEESMSAAASTVKQREEREKQALMDERLRLKEKRQQQQEQFAKQQELKRQKEERLAEQNLLELKRQEEVAQQIELKRLRKQQEGEELMKQYERQRILDLKREKLKSIHKVQNSVRRVEGGINVKVLPNKKTGTLMKSGINRDSILNKRKKKLNKRI